MKGADKSGLCQGQKGDKVVQSTSPESKMPGIKGQACGCPMPETPTQWVCLGCPALLRHLVLMFDVVWCGVVWCGA